MNWKMSYDEEFNCNFLVTFGEEKEDEDMIDKINNFNNY
jgi:hypothetical protein